MDRDIATEIMAQPTASSSRVNMSTTARPEARSVNSNLTVQRSPRLDRSVFEDINRTDDRASRRAHAAWQDHSRYPNLPERRAATWPPSTSERRTMGRRPTPADVDLSRQSHQYALMYDGHLWPVDTGEREEVVLPRKKERVREFWEGGKGMVKSFGMDVRGFWWKVQVKVREFWSSPPRDCEGNGGMELGGVATEGNHAGERIWEQDGRVNEVLSRPSASEEPTPLEPPPRTYYRQPRRLKRSTTLVEAHRRYTDGMERRDPTLATIFQGVPLRLPPPHATIPRSPSLRSSLQSRSSTPELCQATEMAIQRVFGVKSVVVGSEARLMEDTSSAGPVHLSKEQVERNREGVAARRERKGEQAAPGVQVLMRRFEALRPGVLLPSRSDPRLMGMDLRPPRGFEESMVSSARAEMGSQHEDSPPVRLPSPEPEEPPSTPVGGGEIEQQTADLQENADDSATVSQPSLPDFNGEIHANPLLRRVALVVEEPPAPPPTPASEGEHVDPQGNYGVSAVESPPRSFGTSRETEMEGGEEFSSGYTTSAPPTGTARQEWVNRHGTDGVSPVESAPRAFDSSRETEIKQEEEEEFFSGYTTFAPPPAAYGQQLIGPYGTSRVSAFESTPRVFGTRRETEIEDEEDSSSYTTSAPPQAAASYTYQFDFGPRGVPRSMSGQRQGGLTATIPRGCGRESRRRGPG